MAFFILTLCWRSKPPPLSELPPRTLKSAAKKKYKVSVEDTRFVVAMNRDLIVSGVPIKDKSGKPSKISRSSTWNPDSRLARNWRSLPASTS